MAAVLRRFYGPRSERFDPRQLLLFGREVDTMPVDTPSIEEEAGQELVTRRVHHKHGRQRLPETLPHTRIEHDLPEDEKKCPCCGEPRQRIGEEVSEQLEFIPASLKVLQHVRFKYACKACEQAGEGPQIEAADEAPAAHREGPARGRACWPTSSPANSATICRSTAWNASSPARASSIARSTMCAWLRRPADLVRPLVELMADRVRQSAG